MALGRADQRRLHADFVDRHLFDLVAGCVSYGHHVADTWTVRIRLSENDYVNLSREFDTESPPIVARFTDAIGKMLPTKTSEMLRADPIHPDIAIADRQVQPANRVSKPLAPITATIRNL